jgi:predicted phage tail protein
LLEYNIEGSKGGGDKPHTPVETPNNLLSVAQAKILIAVAEGTLGGTPTGKDIFLGGTPLLDANGNPNFGGVTWEWRSGTSPQTYIQGMPDVSNEMTVGVELTSTTPYVRAITKSTLSAVRVTLSWAALMQQQSNGDTTGYKIDYAIDIATNGGAYVLYSNYTVDGKTNTTYERTHRVNLPTGTNWSLRVRRITPNSQSSTIQDTMTIKSVAEVIDVKQTYPNTALLFVQFDSRLFGGTIPKISVRTKGKVIRVPDNYDPETRSYSGTWSGAFKWAYSNNPAWVFYDIVTGDRYGLGSRVTADQIDKWALYEVAQYCDVLVDDGKGAGTKEPRHTCNIYIQSKADAWTVLRDIASIFNGMTYWNGNKFVAVADKQEPLDNIPVFGRSNVVNGKFNYQTTDVRSINTSALVSYDDPNNHFNTEVEAVWEKSQILRWGGDKQTTMSAIGCTSRGQAQRMGKYNLITNMYNRTVVFKTGLQGLNEQVAPGSVIGVADPLIAGKPFTGRLASGTTTVVTLDRTTEAKAGDKLFITKSDGTTQGRTVSAVSGKVITLTTAYSEVPKIDAVWYLEASDLKSQLFRVIKITSPSESIYEITAAEYNDSKFAAIDNGARLEARPISKVPSGSQAAPASVTVSAKSYTEQTLAVTTMTVSWPQTPNATLYEGQWRVGSGDWVPLGTTGGLNFDVKGIYTGAYIARVRAINASGVMSVWKESVQTNLAGKVGAPPALTSLTVTPIVFGMQINWTFPQGAEDSARTEIMYSQTQFFADAKKLGDFAYPQASHEMNGLKAGQRFFFWGRLVDRTGNVGPYFPLTTAVGVMGESSTDFSEYEEYFKDQINNSALGQELAERIDKIEVIERTTEIIEAQLGATEASVAEVKESTDLAVSDLNRDVDLLNNDLAALQTQVDNIKDAALYDPTKTYVKGDSVRVGDRLYQAKQAVPINTSPPNTTYWLDVGQVVEEAGAVAVQVGLNTVAISNQGGILTAQGQKLDALDVRIEDAEGDIITQAGAISNLQTTVTTQGNTITSQGNSITALNNSLITTNTNVTAAQNAANAANTLAGGKGKVLVQSTTPVAADQLAQNLWIDTTGGANTPKRWSGSAWLAVTDKVATDAAAAASSALTQVATKADSSVVSALTGRVTTAEGLITSQGSDIVALNQSIGSVGGENLLYNPSFDKPSTTTGLADGWTSGGTAVVVPTLVASTLDPAGFTQRVDATSLSASVYADVITAVTKRPVAVTGQIHTVSAYVRATVGCSVRLYVQCVNSAGSAIGTTNGTLVTTDGTWQRIVVTSNAAPAGVAKISIIARFYGTAAINTGFAEWDRAQLEISPVVTGWRDSGLALSSAQSATSTALDALTSVVTTQGNTITSVGARTTTLENSVNSPTTGLGSKASATSVDTLTNRVTATETAITASAQDITSLTTEVHFRELEELYAGDETDAQIDDSLRIASGAASATEALTSKVTQVDGKVTAQAEQITNLTASLSNTDGVVAGQAAAVSSLTATVTSQGDAITSQSASITSLGSRVTTAEGTITAQAGAISTMDTKVTDLDGKVTATSTKVDGVYAQVNPTLAGEDAGYAGSDQALAGAWSEQSARIEDGIAMGQRVDTVQASIDDVSAAVQTETLARVNADGALASQVTTVQASVTVAQNTADAAYNGMVTNTAAVQTVAQAQVTADGKASAMWGVKLQVNQWGQYVVAGIGLGIENTSAGLQSSLIVNANNFYISNGVNANVAVPFAVVGGQTFISSAVIQDASITMLKIGDNLQSDNYVAGVSGWRMLKSGTFEINGNIAGQGRMTMTNRSLRVYDGNGVKRVQLGDLTE